MKNVEAEEFENDEPHAENCECAECKSLMYIQEVNSVADKLSKYEISFLSDVLKTLKSRVKQ